MAQRLLYTLQALFMHTLRANEMTTMSTPRHYADATDMRARQAGKERRPPSRDQIPGLKLELLVKLQQSLDPETVLTSFRQALSHYLPLVGVGFTDTDGNTWHCGGQGRHKQTYQLDVKRDLLGELRLSSRNRLSEVELEFLESLTGCLVWPLRNALQHRQALQLALRDRLTECGNRVALDLALERELALSRRHGQSLSLLVLDVDHFKSINDAHGHHTGDEVLRNVASAIREHCRDSDSLFRYGGEEFVLLLPQTPQSGAMQIAERLRAMLASKLWSAGIRATASFGVAELTAEGNAKNLFERADNALYEAKRSGRNRVVCAHY